MSSLKSFLKEAEDKVRFGEGKIAEICDVQDIRELHFELTYLCNERCVMCDVWPRYKIDPVLKQEELSSEEIFRFVEKSGYLKKLNMVLFSGGEPFLRKDLPELCKFFISRYKNISVGILTNLFATNLVLTKVKQILKYKPSDLWIGSSIDGIGDTHDLIRGMKGAFKALDESIKAMKKEFPKVRVGLNFTLTTENYHELEKVYDYANSQGLSFSAQFAVPWKDAKQFSWSGEQLASVRESVYRILEKMVQDYDRQCLLNKIDRITGAHLRRHLLSTLFYWKGLIDYQEKPSRRFERCVAGFRFLQISPAGDLYFCPILKNKTVGNIRDSSYDFDALWTSEEAQRLREFISAGRCHCWLNCTIYPNLQDALSFPHQSIRRKFMLLGWRFLNKMKIS